MRNLVTAGLILAGLAACAPKPAAPEPTVPVPAAAAPAPAPAATTEVPAAFRGHWDASAEACGSGMSDGRLTIAASRIDFYESGGPVTAVSVKSPTEAAITATLSGEGETWTTTTFRLSADGKSITDVSVPGEVDSMTRVRCPA